MRRQVFCCKNCWNLLHPSKDSQPYRAWSLTTCHMNSYGITVSHISHSNFEICQCWTQHCKQLRMGWSVAVIWNQIRANFNRRAKVLMNLACILFRHVSTKLELESLFCLAWQARIRHRTGIMYCDASPHSPFTKIWSVLFPSFCFLAGVRTWVWLPFFILRLSSVPKWCFYIHWPFVSFCRVTACQAKSYFISWHTGLSLCQRAFLFCSVYRL